ncbi:hypothetical protein CDAR_299511 [Caerostris darwini]|uniref:Uncharacterized protein n=1 Tax=Caerostris darwini TaxID=1538125 RepID=A0AAV4RT44_9ARAC|nr:hypothetical protein CDAR_299511 [Caerostris darwini]
MDKYFLFTLKLLVISPSPRRPLGSMNSELVGVSSSSKRLVFVHGVLEKKSLSQSRRPRVLKSADVSNVGDFSPTMKRPESVRMEIRSRSELFALENRLGDRFGRQCSQVRCFRRRRPRVLKSGDVSNVGDFFPTMKLPESVRMEIRSRSELFAFENRFTEIPCALHQTFQQWIKLIVCMAKYFLFALKVLLIFPFPSETTRIDEFRTGGCFSLQKTSRICALRLGSQGKEVTLSLEEAEGIEKR